MHTDDEDDAPRPLPKVTLFSELRGAVQTGRAFAQAQDAKGRSKDSRGADGTRDRPRVPFGGKAPAAAAQGRGTAGRKAPRKPTAERLWASALYNLGQRETSSGGLHALLAGKVKRYAMRLEGEERAREEADGMELVAAAVARAVAEGLVNDARYAEMKARSWRGQGWGERRIMMEMRRKGLGADVAQDALMRTDADAVDGVEDDALRTKEADLEAAERLCQRKRIGPYRVSALDDEASRARAWRREAGVLARAGFSGDVVRDLLGRPPADSDTDS